MARAKKAATGDERAPVQAVENPILNGPYDEPALHWSYDPTGKAMKVGRRREAGYWAEDKAALRGQLSLDALDAQEVKPYDVLYLVNALRADVKRWRESGYRGTTDTTRKLFAHWFRADRQRRLFFCQREAIETLVYVLELALPGQLARTKYKSFAVPPEMFARLFSGQPAGYPNDDEPWAARLVDSAPTASEVLRRLGCKMATGAGKTVVMAMTIAWAFCNRACNPRSTEFPLAVLVCAPNLTVKERLQVLKPASPNNFYDAFELVPRALREALNRGVVEVVNWHAFAPASEHGPGGNRVVNLGPESPEAFFKNRLPGLAVHAPILVINDEGHHCWRPKPGVNVDEAVAGIEGEREQKEALKEDAEEARVWLAGLDQINASGLAGPGQPTIRAVIDLSATPFHLSTSGFPGGSPFPWLITDFGLMDAIESGIVKVPRLPVGDSDGKVDELGRPDPQFFALWKHIGAALEKQGAAKKKKRFEPDDILVAGEKALTTLASQWKNQFVLDQQSAGLPPPVLIVICETTELSQRVFEYISGERTTEELDDDGKKVTVRRFGQSRLPFPELANTETAQHTVRIDTKLLKELDKTDGESKDDAAKRMRVLIDTVGKPGQPGAQVRCVVSVAMLTEGWDANNVTQILGLRAFESQLLCEQVVGRGLRRRGYEVDPKTGRLPPEHVDVYGIPFTLIPFKGEKAKAARPDAPSQRIHALPDRAHLRIRIPRVEGYTYDVRSSGIECDVATIETLTVRAEAVTVFLKEPKGYTDVLGLRTSPEEIIEQDRATFYEAVRPQQVIFELARRITEALVQGATGPNAAKFKENQLARHHIFPAILRIVRAYVAERVQFKDGVDARELAFESHAKPLIERLLNAIQPVAASKEHPLLPVVPHFKPWLETDDVNYLTRRPVHFLKKSHLNAAPLDSDGRGGSVGERSVIDKLEELDEVVAFTPNDKHIGLVIPYEHQDVAHTYEPDFIVKLTDGTQVVLEVKGGGGLVHDENKTSAKSQAAKKWVAALNNAKFAGRWGWVLCTETIALRDQLRTLMKDAPPEAPGAEAPGAKVLKLVKPTAESRWKTCVPKVSLQAAANAFSDDQLGLELPHEATEWLTWEGMPRLEKDMFVARVVGKCMEPDIADGAWCLFRPIPIERAGDRPVLVRHAGHFDEDTGGQFGVKRLKVVYGEVDGQRTRTEIVLQPRNPDYEARVIKRTDDIEVRVIGEVVQVLGLAAIA
jgi:type III restriction enzyme